MSRLRDLPDKIIIACLIIMAATSPIGILAITSETIIRADHIQDLRIGGVALPFKTKYLHDLQLFGLIAFALAHGEPVGRPVKLIIELLLP